MADVIYELQKFSEFVTFKMVNFTHISINDQIAISCAGLGFLLVLLSTILFIFF